MSDSLHSSYALAKEQYAALGVDTDKAIERIQEIAISVHCWQGDDVSGFERAGQELTGGIAVTGNYPGKASTPDQLRADAEKAFSLIPGKHRFNLHASYLDARLLRWLIALSYLRATYGRLACRESVVVSRLQYDDVVIGHVVDESVLLVDATRPGA